jgi:periplasmic protein TonB
MSDLGSLSQCIVESDSGEARCARRMRGRALLASTCMEIAGLAVLLLWPLLNPAILPSQPILAPIPIFHAAPRTEPVPPREPEHPAARRPFAGLTILQQPPRIPEHSATGASTAPPLLGESLNPALPDGPGAGIGGDTSEAAHVVRPGPRRPVVMSGGVMNALLIHRFEPEYPNIAITMHLSGTVQLRAIIGTDGTIQNIQVVSGNPILANAAVAAVKQWRYQPTRLSGQPVEVETVITVQFQME